MMLQNGVLSGIFHSSEIVKGIEQGKYAVLVPYQEAQSFLKHHDDCRYHLGEERIFPVPIVMAFRKSTDLFILEMEQRINAL